MTDEAGPEPLHAFELSRRLTGPNRYFGGTAVVLTPLGPQAGSATAHAAWAWRVKALAARLGWADPAPFVHRHGQGAVLAFSAAPEQLFTATEVNEWAWERATAALGALALQGFDAAQPEIDDPDAVVAHFAALAAAEHSRPVMRLKAAAAAHGLPVFEDDDTVSLGAGRGSVSHPRAALPLPMDVPWPALHDVPTVLVTGSNGKTTTARLLAAMARAAGLTPGLCSTEGIVVGDALVDRGDYAGPAGARAVLRHREVGIAVLETARGGILRRGLAVTRADAAVVTNVSADHLGEYGIGNVEDIAEAKLVVAHAVAGGSDDGGRGTLVLNGSDAVLMAVAARTPHAVSATKALFARDAAHPALVAHRAAGGATCAAHDGRLLCAWAGETVDLGELNAMPLTLGGAAGYNAENIAAAVLAAAAARLPWDAIRSTLATFGTTPHDNAGRLERWQHRGATVLVDYAHNPDGLAQLLAVARALKPKRLSLLLGQAGNRDDAAIAELARTAAAASPDTLVVKELPKMLRGRPLGEVPALLTQALLGAGVVAGCIAQQPNEDAAARRLLAAAHAGDVVVLPIHTSAVRAALATALAAGPAAALPVYRLRPATPADAAFSYDVTEATMRDHVLQTWGRWVPEEQHRFHTDSFVPATHSVVVVDGAEAGIVAVDRLATHLQLEKLYLMPAWHRTGLGSALLQDLLAQASADGLPVELRVLAVNTGARQLYERHGFVVVRSTPERHFMRWSPP